MNSLPGVRDIRISPGGPGNLTVNITDVNALQVPSVKDYGEPSIRKHSAIILATVIGFSAFSAALPAAVAQGNDGNSPDVQDGGTLSVLTYNVAGLPDIASSSAVPRGPATEEIGRRIADYDVVTVQEDFNYHAHLYRYNEHPHRSPTSGGAGIGSGLNQLSHHSWTGYDRVTWDDCHIGSGDCLTPKGFTVSQLELDDGVVVDLYNLHADAGSTDRDIAARRANLEQLAEYLRTHSADRPVIVAGDTNTRYTRTGDGIAEFADDLGLTDAWVETRRDGIRPTEGSDALVCDEGNPGNDCEVVDKILFRGSDDIEIDVTDFGNVESEFRTDDNAQPSDHYPISAELTWRRK